MGKWWDNQYVKWEDRLGNLIANPWFLVAVVLAILLLGGSSSDEGARWR